VVQPVSDPVKALAEINRKTQPMGVSIWSESLKQAHHLAKKISVGMIWINDTSFGLPHLPWGGWGKAGWGNLFSEFSLQEVTRQKWISQHPGRFSGPRFWWNPYTSWKERLLVKIAENFF
jgi:acyl-CoA reductase-like NAD-dependent aldehyde dehydrogenase